MDVDVVNWMQRQLPESLRILGINTRDDTANYLGTVMPLHAEHKHRYTQIQIHRYTQTQRQTATQTHTDNYIQLKTFTWYLKTDRCDKLMHTVTDYKQITVHQCINNNLWHRVQRWSVIVTAPVLAAYYVTTSHSPHTGSLLCHN